MLPYRSSEYKWGRGIHVFFRECSALSKKNQKHDDVESCLENCWSSASSGKRQSRAITSGTQSKSVRSNKKPESPENKWHSGLQNWRNIFSNFMFITFDWLKIFLKINVAITLGSSHIIFQPSFSSRLGCRVGRCNMRQVHQCFQAFVHSFRIHFLHGIQGET